jgi:ADP-heptose:LPS heptosyltransferase
MNRLTRALQLTLTVVLAVLLQAHGQQLRPTQENPPAAAAVAVQQSSVKFAILGDTGTGGKPQYEIARRLAEAHAKFPFEFVILLGDNMYGGQSATDFKNKFEKPYDALLQQGIKFYASLGNHDRPERQIAYKPFNMGGKRYYTFRPKLGVRFFALDSNYMDKAQIDWLEAELKSSGSDWKILFFHHPLYSSGEKHGSSIELRKVLEPLLIKYGVDVVFSGHEHFYERLKPQNGIEYFILGNSAKLRKGNIDPKSAISAKGFDTDNAFMMAEVAGDGMNFHTISRAGKVVDTGSFIRAELRDGKK